MVNPRDKAGNAEGEDEDDVVKSPVFSDDDDPSLGLVMMMRIIMIMVVVVAVTGAVSSACFPR